MIRTLRGLAPLAIVAVALAACSTPAPEPSADATTGTTGDVVEISFVSQLEPAEIPPLEELIAQFEAENPNIRVKLDHVSYSQVLESLPLQLETGEAPDIMRMTRFELAPYFLDLSPYVDVDYWMDNMGPTQEMVSAGEEPHPTGMFSNVTVTGGFVNTTLFEQAGVDVPDSNATWDEWRDAAVAVAEVTGTTAMAIDRSGHRLVAPAINMGAQFFDAEGNVQLVGDEGFKAWLERFVEWNNDGTMNQDFWATGDAFREARDDFVAGKLVFLYSGNWNVGTLDTAIGDAFDWAGIAGPCGPAACTAMPGGGIFVGFKGTEHPEAVAAFLDFLVQEDNYRYWAESTLDLPQHSGLIEQGLDFKVETPAAGAAMNVFAQSTEDVSSIATDVLTSPIQGAILDTLRDRATQAITGELSVDEAIERMQQDIDAAAAAVG